MATRRMYITLYIHNIEKLFFFAMEFLENTKKKLNVHPKKYYKIYQKNIEVKRS